MGKSQIEVAKAVGISNAALSNYETGYREPDLDTLCALARYYELTLDELVNVNNEQQERIYDISTAVKDTHIKFKGDLYELKASQKKVLLRELDTVFEKFQRSRITSIKEGTSHRHPHINRGGLLGANLAVSRGKMISFDCMTNEPDPEFPLGSR